MVLIKRPQGAFEGPAWTHHIPKDRLDPIRAALDRAQGRRQTFDGHCSAD